MDTPKAVQEILDRAIQVHGAGGLSQDFPLAASYAAVRTLRFADVTLDEARHEVHRGETRVDLTATEFSLLRYFLLNPRRVLSKGQILQNVWRYDFGGNSNVVETYVSYLRKKLDALGPPLIRTIRQAGYMLETEE